MSASAPGPEGNSDSTPANKANGIGSGIAFGRLSRLERGWLTGVLRDETVGGFLLLGAAVLALILANSGWSGKYFQLVNTEFGPSALHLHLSLEAWAADGLLAIFFFVAGLELKHEFVHGSLQNARAAIVPVTAALSGMVVPAIFFVIASSAASKGSNPALDGWGIPMATDIAFALAVLAVLGRGLPASLRAFLLTLAVVDDLGAISVIAIFYTDHVYFGYLAIAVIALVGYYFAQRMRVRTPWLYVPLALIAWWAMHASGVHATVEGIALGLLTRMSVDPGEEQSPGDRLEHRFRPISAGFCVPVFAFLAAGVNVRGMGVHTLITSPVALGITAGLVLGKPIGVIAGAEISGRLAKIRRSTAVGTADLLAIGMLAGIGFTVSLLVSELAFPEGTQLDEAKTAVLIASVVSAILAGVVLLFRRRHYVQTSQLDADEELPDVPDETSDPAIDAASD
jgi:NhaA family Na+:H+ antiporter